MEYKKKKVPVVDIFAGPGGLSEGFHRYSSFRDDRNLEFDLKLSIEKDKAAYSTLTLRAYTRQFPEGKIPKNYYNYISENNPEEREKILSKIKKSEEWKKAESETLHATLGEVPKDEVDRRIKQQIGSSEDWVLLGGPPCQAYSVIGRARRLGKLSGRETEMLTDPSH